MKMRGKFRDGLWKIYSFVSAFEFTSGVVFVVTLSCVLSIVTNHFNISGHTLSLESSVVLNGHVFQMSESKACVFEKMVPFRLLKKITWVHFVPASAGERKKILHTICSPSPGSYPVQAYAPASMFASQAKGNALSSVDGWSHPTIIQQNYTIPSLNPGYSIGPRFGSSHGHTHGHDCGHGHSHQYQASDFWMPKFPYAHSHFSPHMNMVVQSFGNPSHTTVQADSVASVPVLST